MAHRNPNQHAEYYDANAWDPDWEGSDRPDWVCPSCATPNLGRNNACKKCGQPAPKYVAPTKGRGATIFKQGDWRCDSCNNVNWDWRESCNRCTQLRPDVALAVVAKREADRNSRRKFEGVGGGFFDRQAVEKNAWNSDDEEFDEFGRAKKKKGPPEPPKVEAPAAAPAAAEGGGAPAEGQPKEEKKLTPKEAAKAAKEAKRKAALERLYNKHSGGGGGARDRSRSPR